MLATCFQNALFLTHTLECAARELATNRERDSCNKRFSLVLQKPRAFLESSALQVCQSYSLSLLDPMRKFCSCPSGSLSLPLYPALPRMQPVAVARKLKVTEYCSSPREPTRREAAFASFQTAYILEQFLAILA